MSSAEKGTYNSSMVAYGLIAGVIFGSIFDNIGLGIALGLCFGAGLAYSLPEKHVDNQVNESNKEEQS